MKALFKFILAVGWLVILAATFAAGAAHPLGAVIALVVGVVIYVPMIATAALIEAIEEVRDAAKPKAAPPDESEGRSPPDRFQRAAERQRQAEADAAAEKRQAEAEVQL